VELIVTLTDPLIIHSIVSLLLSNRQPMLENMSESEESTNEASQSTDMDRMADLTELLHEW
jgi:hypothetical protein